MPISAAGVRKLNRASDGSLLDRAGQFKAPVSGPIQKRRPIRKICSVTISHEAANAPQQAAILFDHLVGSVEQLVRNFKAERLRGLQVDGESEFGRQLYR